nr:hypothetical protein [Tanacetum cinerariifolium]
MGFDFSWVLGVVEGGRVYYPVVLRWKMWQENGVAIRREKMVWMNSDLNVTGVRDEEQAVKAQSWKFPVCYDDDDDEEGYNSVNDNIISELPPYSAVTPTETIDSLSMGDEHLDIIPATESDEFIKSCVKNLVPNPSKSNGENGCDMPAGFTSFSNVLFDDDYDSDSSDDQSLSDEDVQEKIYSNPLFDEEIIPMEIDSHSFNAESDLIESLPNHDSSSQGASLLWGSSGVSSGSVVEVVEKVGK